MQVPEARADQATLTDVSNTTGTRPADAQTEFAMTDAEIQHESSDHDLTESETETAETEVEALYDLTDFAMKTNGRLYT